MRPWRQLALYEGDAVAVSAPIWSEHPALALAFLREVGRDFPEMDEAPASVGIALLFPYTSGSTFVDRLLAEGGWDAVDAAYADMPASTEQILHPLKYLERDEPVARRPARSDHRARRRLAHRRRGHARRAANRRAPRRFRSRRGLQRHHRRHRPAGSRPQRRRRLGRRPLRALGGGGERETLVWRSVWDTPQDARAFSRALAQFGNTRWGGVFNGESPDDVALVTPEIAARIVLDGQEVLYVQAPDLCPGRRRARRPPDRAATRSRARPGLTSGVSGSVGSTRRWHAGTCSASAPAGRFCLILQ